MTRTMGEPVLETLEKYLAFLLINQSINQMFVERLPPVKNRNIYLNNFIWSHEKGLET